MFTSFFGYVKFLDENLQKFVYYERNYSKPVGVCQKRRQTVVDNSGTVGTCQAERAMRRQMFHSEVICKMFVMTEGERGRKVERMLAYYLQKYGFNDEIRLF